MNLHDDAAGGHFLDGTSHVLTRQGARCWPTPCRFPHDLFRVRMQGQISCQSVFPSGGRMEMYAAAENISDIR